jgi:peptidoglycan/LPS O-acetylase OafA/YrhL
LYPFVGGAVAAAVVHVPKLREQMTVRGADVLALLCIWLAYVAIPPGSGLVLLLLLTAGFTLIACGADIFGLLRWRPVLRLSSLSYGIYLWHGVVLFVVMHYVVGRDRAPTLSLSQHWLVVFACAPVVLGAAALSFRWIERPAMDSVPALTRWLGRIGSAEAVAAGTPDGGDAARSS